MLTYDPKKRITAAEALKDPWLKNNVSKEPLRKEML